MTRPYSRPTVFTPPRDWSDEELLTILHMRDHQQLSARRIADVMGTTRNAVLGLVHRIRVAEQPGTVGDGTLSPDWWRRA